MTCTSAHAAIQNSLDQTPPQAERLALEAHLETCEACRRDCEALRQLTRLAGRWVSRTLEVSNPGEQFTMQVLSRLDTPPAPSHLRVWLPLAALFLIVFTLVWVPSLDVHLSLPSLPGLADWLRANLRALPGDALAVLRLPQASWLPAGTTPLLLGVGLLNAGFCFHARQRSLS